MAQLALPLLITTACARPPRSRSWQTWTGAAAVLLLVNMPQATQGTSEISSARSIAPGSDLMPQVAPPARKPWGAVTLRSTCRKSRVTMKTLPLVKANQEEQGTKKPSPPPDAIEGTRACEDDWKNLQTPVVPPCLSMPAPRPCHSFVFGKREEHDHSCWFILAEEPYYPPTLLRLAKRFFGSRSRRRSRQRSPSELALSIGSLLGAQTLYSVRSTRTSFFHLSFQDNSPQAKSQTITCHFVVSYSQDTLSPDLVSGPERNAAHDTGSG